MPYAGTPRRLSRANGDGNRPLRAAACGISPTISVQPTSAPSPETIAATATMSPAHRPPKIALAESENGAVDATSAPWLTVPNTATVPRMYTAAQARVPNPVARPTLRRGFTTRPAATEAVSIPMYANKAIAAAALIAPSAEPPPALNSPKLADLMNSSPTVAMNSSGTNFSTVVTICTTDRLRIPARLTAAGTHRPASAIRIDQPLACDVFPNTST